MLEKLSVGGDQTCPLDDVSSVDPESSPPGKTPPCPRLDGRPPPSEPQISPNRDGGCPHAPGDPLACTKPSMEAVAAGCPFHARLLAQQGSETAATEDASASLAQGSLQIDLPDGSGAEEEEEDGVVECPMGYGRSRLPRLGEFFCLVCKSLFCDCSVLGCGHRFCKGCIELAPSCLVCGADVGEVRADADAQERVDRYIGAHAGQQTLWEVAATGKGGRAPTPASETLADRSRAGFFLQLGVRHLAAGNASAALTRLERCTAELDEAESAEAPSSVRIRSGTQRGAALGCMGDALRAQGRREDALRLYRRAAQELEALVEAQGGVRCREAASAAAVALNKAGDLLYAKGDLLGGEELYARALRLRRSALEAVRCERKGRGEALQDADAALEATRLVSTPVPPAPSPASMQQRFAIALLDAATSEVKLADALAALGCNDEAQEHVTEARGLAEEIALLEDGLASPQAKRLAGIREFLADKAS